MADLPDITSSWETRYGLECLCIEVADRGSYLRADFNPRTQNFSIEGFYVLTPHVGLGKELLRQTEREAREIGAARLVAIITSAECLASMTTVFGEEHITITHQGNYSQENTRARLILPLVPA